MFPTDSDLKTQFTFETESTPIDESSPFQILLFGNWSGRAVKADLSERKPIEIDRDNFEDVMRRLKVSVELNLFDDKSNFTTLSFNEIEDFHPDNLFSSCSMFDDLRHLRRRLLDNNTFESAAREVRSLFDQSETKALTEKSVPSISNLSPVSDSKGLLDQILFQSDETSSTSFQPRPHSDELQKLVGHAIKPFLVNTDENEQTKLLRIIDEAISRLMTKILSSSDFKDLESAWRGLYLLVRQIETESDLKIFIYDLTKNELSHNLQSNNDLTESFLYRLLFSTVDFDLNSSTWSLLAGNYTFDSNVDDIALLIRLSQLSASAKAPFISSIRPESLGVSLSSDSEHNNVSFDTTAEKLWTTIRSLPESEYIGLATPRYLARLPYGGDTNPVETFNFEEFDLQSEDFDYLWSNPCFICVILIAQSFQRYGWNMENIYVNELDGFPVHIYQNNGETKTKNSVEFMPTSNKYQKLLDLGLIPLFSQVNSDKIKAFRFQSISSPSKPLKGKWNR
ncbi:MAG: type VI secretion system contractile sheath large subunit [Acidobacteriota bacterium]|nr:type VI secretion system contractile sheath large subunit [Acidobacteriota bacterium]